jgi:hypothetical protein
MPSDNERAKLAMELLECRQKLRRVAWDEEQVKHLLAEMERLAQRLREIDE